MASSVIPYVSDQLAMARLPRATYALMVSLLPATATVIGIIVLTQIPTAKEIIGVVLVVAGVALHHERTAFGLDPAALTSARSGLETAGGPQRSRRCKRNRSTVDRLTVG